jgi:Tol biopolymer transport system component
VAFRDLPGREVARELNGVRLDVGYFAVGPGDLLANVRNRDLRVLGAGGRPLWSARLQEPGYFYAVAFSRDGKWLAAASLAEKASEPHRVWVWEAGTGKRVRSWELGAAAEPAKLALSPDGSLVAVVMGNLDRRGRKPGELRVHEAATGKRLYALEPPPHGFRAAVFSADGRALATGEGDGAVCVREAATGRLRWRFTGHTGPVCALSFSPDGRLLVSGCYSGDHTLLVWDLTGRPFAGRTER